MIPLADDVDLDGLAATTVGMVGADLASLAKEAALLAARRSHERVEMADFSDALERIVPGAERKVMMSPADRRRMVYHDAGHTLTGMLTPGADTVRKIPIIPVVENRDRLDALADVLIRKGTLEEAEAYAAAGVEPPPETEPLREEPEPVRSGAILTTFCMA